MVVRTMAKRLTEQEKLDALFPSLTVLISLANALRVFRSQFRDPNPSEIVRSAAPHVLNNATQEWLLLFQDLPQKTKRERFAVEARAASYSITPPKKKPGKRGATASPTVATSADKSPTTAVSKSTKSKGGPTRRNRST